MFIKYGEKRYLEALKDKGSIYFNPAVYFRNLEIELQAKGMADRDDSGIVANYTTATLTESSGRQINCKDINLSFIVQPCENMPIFCMKKFQNEFITTKYREELREQFPEYTHALLIDEKSFLENVRYNFRNRSFVHNVFYEDKFTVDFIKFLKTGNSWTRFYQPKSKSRYYATLTTDTDNGKTTIRIDDSNCFKTMFRKSEFFTSQREVRIVLPYESIEKGKEYKISPVNARLVEIDSLIKA